MNLIKISLKNLVIAFFVFLFVAQVNAQIVDEKHKIDTNKVLEPEIAQSKVTTFVSMYMTMYHYKKSELNDSLSVSLWNEYLKDLDNGKYFFLASDIKGFEKYKTKLDQSLITGNLTAPFEIFNIFKKRFNSRMAKVIDYLKTEPDFTIEEDYYPDRTEVPWAKTEVELDQIWSKRLKNETLSVKLGGKSWKDVSDIITKRYVNYHKFILQYKPEEVFQIFMNAFTGVIDPHSAYFSPAEKDNFNINMSLSLEGIGARLKTENDYTVIASIVVGSPAAFSGKLQDGDKIMAVAQGDTGQFVEVFGWRIDDVVQLIRGSKGTKVRLSVLKANAAIDAQPEVVSLIRDKIKFEEQASKKEIKTMDYEGQAYKIGIITVPTFYLDFEGKRKGEKDYKSTTRDVNKLLAECKAENVDGILIDLRNNGGGSLTEAIELTGLFIKDGPVVQVRNIDGSVEVDKDPNPSIAYSGPLMVMVNRFSASASEIFSAAIQDYGRGVILGEQTYGKGTVQSSMNLNQVINIDGKKLGQLNYTIAKFYRITGGSTQHRGVVPDIQFPSAFKPGEFGESAEPHALPWDSIKSADYQRFSNLSSYIPTLEKQYVQHSKINKEFKFYIEDIEDLKLARKKKFISLNEEKRKSENKITDEKKKSRNVERLDDTKLDVTGDEENEGVKPVTSIKKTDALLEESMRILAGFVKMIS